MKHKMCICVHLLGAKNKKILTSMYEISKYSTVLAQKSSILGPLVFVIILGSLLASRLEKLKRISNIRVPSFGCQE